MPRLEVNMTLSSVYNEKLQTFHLFGKPQVRMLLSPRKACSAKNVVMIPSAPRNKVLRDMLRNKLGEKVYLLFLLGRTGSQEGDKMLKNESDQENDILQGDFHDSYELLTYKVVMGYIWLNR